MQKIRITALILALAAFVLTTQAAIYKETGGIVVVEAEHFDKRTIAADDHHWHVVPDDDGKDALADTGDPPFDHARGGKYVQSLPDSAGGGQNKNNPGDVGTDGYIEYKVQINTPGTYRLWLRWGGYDGSSDSIYGEIVELRDGVGGKVNDWYRFARTLANNDFDASGWDGSGGPELQDAGGGEVPANWEIPSAGTYTIRISQREDGSVLDAVILQLASLAAPTNPGPPESATASAFITITKQPADVSVAIGQTASLTVAATGSSAPTFQWQKAPAGSTNFVNIAGATGTNLTTAALTVADDGTQYRVALTATTLTINSRVATVTVDTTPPIAYRAVGSATFNNVTIVYSEAVLPSVATNVANYSISGLTISAAKLTAGGSNVVLTTSLQTTGTVYTVTVKDIKDLVSPANVLAPNPTTLKFTGWVLTKGGALQKYWDNITPNNIAALTGNARFPDNPTFVTIEPAFEYPPNGANEAGSNYGNQLTAFLSPTVTGSYVFFVCSDDPSELYLSTNENPANKKLIAQETSWSNARQWVNSGGNSDLTSKRSDQFGSSAWPTPNVINLTAGKLYYMEALHTEGGGGDNVGVTWQLPGAAEPVDGAAPIPGANLFTYLNPDVSTATVTISSPKDGATFPVGANITITADAVDKNGPIRKVEFFSKGIKIGESTTAPFTVTLNNVASGRYTLTANALDRQGYVVTSAAVKITAGTPPPAILFVTDPVPLTFAGDIAVVQHLQKRGFDVESVIGSTVPANGSTALGKNLIIESSSLGSGTVEINGVGKFRDLAIPAMEWEASSVDAFGFQEANSTTTAGQTQINIVDSTSPLAAGFPKGLLTVSASETYSQGQPVGAHIVATLADDPTQAVIFNYEKGEKGFNGFVMPERRVFFFFQDNTASVANDNGWKLFDAAVDWLLGGGTVKPPAPTLSVARTPTGLTLTFTGTLQSASAITGPWADEANAKSPFAVTSASGLKFYRAKQ